MSALQKFLFVIAGMCMLSITSCKDENDNIHATSSIVKISFKHYIDNSPVIYDSLMYVNEAGNVYEISEIQWFIADLTLTSKDNVSFITQEDNIHYIDSHISQTLEWVVSDGIPEMEVSNLRFTFGLKGDKNTPSRFPDFPEVNMMWPYHMGGDQGGYHYMKMNGFWVDPAGVRQAFNFHVGVGREEDPGGTITFVQNWFETFLELNNERVSSKDTLIIPILMNIENWFKNPNLWDHNDIGGKIMNNQQEMKKACENGRDVFTIGDIELVEKE